MNELTQKGVEALKAGDRAAARQALTQAVKENPRDSQAWLWLSGALDTDAERAACLENVLRIDPNNAAAARGLEQIRSRARTAQERERAAREKAEQERASAEADALERAVRQPADSQASSGEWQPGAIIRGSREPGAIPRERTTAGGGLPFTNRAREHAPAPSQAPAVVELPAAVEQPAAGEQPDTAAITRHKRTAPAAVEGAPETVIFRSRPSFVPALAAFWLFFFGALAIAVLLSGAPTAAMAFAGALVLVLELMVLFVIARNFATGYVLTDGSLTMRLHGKKTRIPVSGIMHVECRQSFLQRLIGIGDVVLDASVHGRLAQLRLRDVAQCKKKVEMILRAAGLVEQ